jgi:2-keto-3-deoxy-L-rhamnonate aldolase RhmA
VIPLIETVEAGENIQSLINVPDVDAFFFGPADYSASSGYPGEWEGEGVGEEILRVKDHIRSQGFPCGIMATDLRNGQMRLEQGFQLIGIGADAGLLIRAMTEMMQGLGKTVSPDIWQI